MTSPRSTSIHHTLEPNPGRSRDLHGLTPIAEIWIWFGEARNDLRKLCNGVEGPLHPGSCHQTRDRQKPRHRPARSASRISALACRNESWIRLAKQGEL